MEDLFSRRDILTATGKLGAAVGALHALPGGAVEPVQDAESARPQEVPVSLTVNGVQIGRAHV